MGRAGEGRGQGRGGAWTGLRRDMVRSEEGLWLS